MSSQRPVWADVLIVGSGAAGVAASIEAAEAGAEVVVLEKEPAFGGAAAISGGGCCLVGTPLQRSQGIEDSPDLAFADWVRCGQGAADEVWARYYVEHTLHDLYDWAEARGVRWTRLIHQEHNSVPRWHQPVHGGGGLWRILHKAAVAAGARTWLSCTAARELILDKGRVIGIRAERVDTKEPLEFFANAVVMATGGIGSNLDMVREYRPDLHRLRILAGGHAGATGEGYRMAERAGAVLTHMDQIWLYVYAIPDHVDPTGTRGLVIRGIPDAIWVNAQGRRFHNESLTGGDTGAPAVMAQEPPECWAILDSATCKGMMVADPQYYLPESSDPDWAKAQALLRESPHIASASTLEELAHRMGVPTQAFVEAIKDYNADFDGGLDRDHKFGRPLAGLRKIEQPPYYALHFVPLARKTFGGVKTNLRCQALDKRYAPIPGLYAAGELAGMAGGHINGKAALEGTMLGPSLFSGRVAGAWAACEAGFGEGFAGKPNLT
jgi:flavocytochrome c